MICKLNIYRMIHKKKQKNDDEAITLHHSFYVIFIDQDRKKLEMKNIDELKKYFIKESILKQVKAVQINIDLTKRFKLNQLDLDNDKNGIHLKFGHKILFHLEWNMIHHQMAKIVDGDNVIAKFIKKKCLLKITCPLLQR